MFRAKRSRKAMGGGMRQAGVIAAPMLVALEETMNALKHDHDRAARFAEGTIKTDGFAFIFS